MICNQLLEEQTETPKVMNWARLSEKKMVMKWAKKTVMSYA